MRRFALIFFWLAFSTGCPDDQDTSTPSSMDATPMDASTPQPDTRTDASVDARLADAAPADAEFADAAPADAAPADAEFVDAARADAAPADAAPADAAPADAAPADAAPADAAPADAAPADAAPVGPAIVALDGSGDYLDLQSALDAAEADILVRAGVYEVDRSIVFENDGTTLRGEDANTVRFVQTVLDHDLFVVRGDDVTISDVTLDTTVTGQAAFVEQGANGLTLRDSIIRGGDQIFSVYFAGPEVAAGDETLDAFAAGALSRGNRLLRNTITSAFVGDSVSFSLQADGEVRDNTIATGMLALYMLQNVVCAGNEITDSPTNGIFISLPSRDLVVTDNIVSNAHYSAIVIKPQVEHPAANRELDSVGVVLEDNRLTTRFFGIEIDGTRGDPTQGRLIGPTIRGNEIEIDDFAGIYMLRLDAPVLRANTITFTAADTSRRGVDGRLDIIDMVSSAVYLDVEVTGPVLEENVFTRAPAVDDPQVMQNAVVIHAPSVTDARITDNTFRRHGDPWVHSPCRDDFGPRDRDGVFDLSGGVHTVNNNLCEDALE